MEFLYGEYLISDDKSRIEQSVVLDFLAGSYWANQRTQDRTVRAIANSYCLGAFKDGRQVGFARVVSDGAVFYYICDVFVLDAHRGKGIGKKLIETIVGSDRFQGMSGMLGTKDAHGLYEKFGFVKDSERFMRRPPNG